jgi:predicted nucleotidyltransferase
MLSKNEMEVINLFRKNPFQKLSTLQINKELKKKAYSRVYDAVKSLQKNNIIKITKIGNANLAELNLNHRSIPYLCLLDEEEAIERTIPNLEKLASLKEISNYLLIVTGSYARGTQKKSSDLDLVILIPDNEKAIDSQKMIENIIYLLHPPVHLFVLNQKDFTEMLIEKKENYGKEIFRNRLLLKNAEIYYGLLKEAIENGFRG